MWQYVAGWLVPDIWKEYRAFVCKMFRLRGSSCVKKPWRWIWHLSSNVRKQPSKHCHIPEYWNSALNLCHKSQNSHKNLLKDPALIQDILAIPSLCSFARLCCNVHRKMESNSNNVLRQTSTQANFWQVSLSLSHCIECCCEVHFLSAPLYMHWGSVQAVRPIGE
jgi:hypothetical protein